MKILYISAMRAQGNAFSSSEESVDLSDTVRTIVKGVKSRLPEADISLLADVFYDPFAVNFEEFDKFDLFIIDATASPASILYLAGVAQGKGKPVIYFSNGEHDPALLFVINKILFYSSASIKSEFISELCENIQMASNEPHKFMLIRKTRKPKPKAFISYSHSDKIYLSRLKVHLKPLERLGILDVWEDQNIKVGDDWQDAIDKALSEANIAILLLSADFMASDFIVENELPPLLAKAEVRGTRIVPVILSPCRFLREPTLSRFQAANAPNNPISRMGESEREGLYDKIASDIELAVRTTDE